MNTLVEKNDQLTRQLSKRKLLQRKLAELTTTTHRAIMVRGIEINMPSEISDSNAGSVIYLAAQQMLIRKIEQTEKKIRSTVADISNGCEAWLDHHES